MGKISSICSSAVLPVLFSLSVGSISILSKREPTLTIKNSSRLLWKIEEKVSLPGDSNCIPQLIEDARIFVLSSDFEGMPNALLEAMAIGIPSISTDCQIGGPKELIDDGGF